MFVYKYLQTTIKTAQVKCMFKGQPSKGQVAEKKHQRQGNKLMKSCIVSIVRFRPFCWSLVYLV